MGNEVVCRMGTAYLGDMYYQGFHPTSTCGTMGAAVSAAKLMKLDEQKTVYAQGIAGSMVAGLMAWNTEGSFTTVSYTHLYFATWIGMDIGIPTYYLASSLIVGGMDLKWAMFTILLANVIIAFPILANGHAGAKYGIPSTIYWRSAFGFNGASVAAILRGVVAAGWCGIQFWL